MTHTRLEFLIGKILFLALLISSSNIVYSQVGCGAFEVSGTMDGAPSDWFGVNGVIDSTYGGGAGSADMVVPEYTIVNGELWLDAVYGRDFCSDNGIPDPTSYIQASKNGEDPFIWNDGPALVQNKNDIVDVFGHARRIGTAITDPLYFYFGMAKSTSNGEAFWDAELFVNDIPQDFDCPGGVCHTTWEYDAAGNLISSGDVIVANSFSGPTLDVSTVRLWVTEDTYNNIDPVGYDWTGDFDGDGQNATEGYASITFGGVCGAGNTVDIDTAPWGGLDETCSTTGTYEPGRFSEVGLDLTALGIGTGSANSNPCDSPFASIVFKTRASNSFTSQLKDYAGPYPFGWESELDAVILGDTIPCDGSATLQAIPSIVGAYYEWADSTATILSSGTNDSLFTTSTPGKYYLSTAPTLGCDIALQDSFIVYAYPCAVVDSFTTNADSPFTIDVILNDTDDDLGINSNSLIDPTSTAVVSPPAAGTLVNNGDGTFTYTPDINACGVDGVYEDEFQYLICDETNLCDTTTVGITVLDNINPTITCPADITMSNDAGECNAIVNWTVPTPEDNCPGTTITSASNDPNEVFPVGTTTVSYVITDAAGNTAECSFDLTVVDNENPTITCPADITVSSDAGICTASGVDLGSPVTGDNCGIASITNDSSEPYVLGNNTITWTVTDDAGNTAICTQTVTVEDTEDPTIECPADITVSSDAGICTASGADLGTPVTTDNCGVASVVNDGVEPYALGTTTITWTVTDDAGNTAICTQTITVEDTEDPTITCPADITVDVDAGICTASGVDLGLPVTSDNCGVASVVNDGVEPYALGDNTITWTVTDDAGNTAICTQTVTVEDTEDPTITCPVDITVSSDAGICTASGVDLGTPVTSDNCGVASVVNDGVEPYALGTTTITWTVTDDAGNTAICTQTVTVEDTEDPTIECPADITVSSDAGICTASGVDLGTPVTSDNCGVASVVNDGVEPYALGTTTITWTVTDDAGNTAICTQTVTVEDTEDPTIECPADITVSSDAGICTASGVDLGTPVTTDNCGVASVVNDGVEPYGRFVVSASCC